MLSMDAFYAECDIKPSRATAQETEGHGTDDASDLSQLKRGSKKASVVFIESRIGNQCLRGTGFCIKNSTSTDEGTL